MSRVASVAITRLASLSRPLRQSGIALVDQLIVSAMSFLTLAIVGRVSKEELGIFAFGMTVSWTIISFQDALVALPMVALMGRRGDPKLFLGSSLFAALCIAGISSVLMVVSCIGALSTSQTAGYAPLLLVMTVALPFFMLRQFVRRANFAQLQFSRALWLDVLGGTLQLAIIAVLWNYGSLTGVTGHVAIGIASFVITTYWLFHDRHSYTQRPSQAIEQIRQNWRYSRSMLISQLFGVLHVNVILWAVSWYLGEQKTGQYAATYATIMLVNPLVLGMLNALTPRAAHGFQNGDFATVRKVVFSSGVAMVCGVLLLWGGLLLLGDPAMQLIYGASYGGQASLIAILGLSTVAETACKAPEHGLNVIEKPQLVANVNLIRFAIVLVALVFLLPKYELIGAGLSLLISDLFAAVALAILFARNSTSPKRFAPS